MSLRFLMVSRKTYFRFTRWNTRTLINCPKAVSWLFGDGGIPQNKITAIAGESATGKTFFVLGVVQAFLETNPEANVVFFESESAITKDMIEERGIDSSRMVILPVATVQEFRYQSLAVLEAYENDEDQKPLLICLDLSLIHI